MTKCDAFIADLVDAASNELPPARRSDFEEHLAACADCRRELAVLSDTNALLTATRNEPDDLTLSGFAYRTALAAEARRDTTTFGSLRRVVRAFRTTLYVATAASAVVLALLVVPSPKVPVAQTTVALDEIATATELLLWDVYSDRDPLDQPVEWAGRDTAFNLDDGLSDLTDVELAELIELLNDGSQG